MGFNKVSICCALVTMVIITNVQSQSNTVTKLEGCGSSVGCFSNCQGGICSFIVSWSVNGSMATHTITSNVDPNSGSWMAIAFSADKVMGADDVMGCRRATNGTITVFSAYTLPHTGVNMYTDAEIKLIGQNFTSGLLTCTIQRPLSGVTAGRSDLNNVWTILFAKGLTNAGADIQLHGPSNRFISQSQVKATEIRDLNIDGAPVQTPSTTVPNVSGCGSTVGCFSDCQGSTCSFIVSWSVSGNIARYTVTTNVDVNNGSWIAVAFSNDTIMQDDDVIGCTRDSNGNIALFSAKTPLHSRPIMYNDTELKLTSRSFTNGLLSCTLERPVTAAGSNRVDVSNEYTLFFAKGPYVFNATLNQYLIRFHSTNHRISASKVKVSDLKDIGVLVTQDQTTQTPSGSVTKLPGCGTTVGCFSNCQGSACGFLVSWTVSGTTATYTIISSAAPNSAVWMAVAFSNDTIMRDDDVIGCSMTTNGAITVFNARTPFQSTPVLYTDAEQKLTSGTYSNGLLTCTLQRPVAAGANGRVNVENSWILFFARGQAVFDATKFIPQYHEADKFISAEQVKVSDKKDVNVQGAPTSPTTQKPPAGTLTKPKDCGTTMGCLSNCEGSSSCGYYISWQINGANVEYNIAANIPSLSYWIALAFSNDNKMGNDDVIGCAITSSGAIDKFTANNNVYQPPTMKTDPEVSLTSYEYKDNSLFCKIRRPISGSDSIRRVNLNTTWTMLFAIGPASFGSNNQPQIQKHINTYVADKPLAANSTEDLGSVVGASDKSTLIKAHGSLMITAWVLLASIGIVLARYYKPVWKSLLCSEKVWFQLHRLCMFLVFLTTAAGFIIIFIAMDGYSDIYQKDQEFLVGHPIIGIIVMILTVLNPLMALFRCHPGTPKRPIFNWAHWFVGTSAHILGVVNIFFGFLLNKTAVPYYLVYILGAYVAWQIFVELLLEVITCSGKRADRSEAYELTPGDNHKQITTEESSGTRSLKRIILIVHCFIVLAFAAVLIGLLNAGNEKLK